MIGNILPLVTGYLRLNYPNGSLFGRGMNIYSEGDEFEDVVAALFQINGYYIEKNIDQFGLFELDTIATSYLGEEIREISIQAKSGKEFNFSDVFKECGKMHYLNIKEGCFVAQALSQDKDIQRHKEAARKMGIRIVYWTRPDISKTEYKELLLEKKDSDLINQWQRFYILERCFFTILRETKAKYVTDPINYDFMPILLDYSNRIKYSLYLEGNCIERINTVYHIYKKHPKLTLETAYRLEGKKYNQKPIEKCYSFNEALYEGEYPLLQCCFYLENRARIVLLKYCVDYLVQYGTSNSENMPSPFKTVLEYLAQISSWKKIPSIIQSFIWNWGGFFLIDKIDEEYCLFAKELGVEINDIHSALIAYTTLFPNEKSWWSTTSNNELKILKLLPIPIHGLGVLKRMKLYGVKEPLSLSSGRTSLELTKWFDSLESWLGQQRVTNTTYWDAIEYNTNQS
jgi:hypothetical protein